ncbi:RES family NAD+ phosphorylase [Enterobacter chuandaensis]|uniref:RES family NAD+ phosphorylase n=1 Tax=Enterobacter chuandaensis TaxID=2497875 RepID=A0AA96M9C1_9ENTR|nr:RES family NAD+ phosphorylase [Enterobacter chuandaensis]MCW4784093.1 RES family NAD+ phosphorylase [Enterobacter chuandaensis]MDA4761378.1 RES family NAD+ phosphorylase [Enterobacter chuandaensis]WNS38082.1 RES family NAD+ phosphorylase [Enterobacter chuandaensis]
MANCCTNCFHDIAIVEFICSDHLNGRCGHCRTDNTQIIQPEKLSQFFEPFLGLVTEDDNGETLSNILQKLFSIFKKQVTNPQNLLCEILGQDYIHKKYRLNQDYQNHANQWEDFKKEIKFSNRFFPQNTIYSSLFDVREDNADNEFFLIIEQLKVDYNVGESFFRARIHDGPLDSSKMGKPPEGNASAGRANPIGISYLYLAENEKTCVAEVRPNYTSIIFISSFVLNKSVQLIDLTSPREKLSICSFDEGRFSNVISILNLLETLSKELSKPVKPESSGIDYIPTQFLCEFLKSFSKCDGIIFESSFGGGKNYVFYEDSIFDIQEPIANKITEISHNFTPK